MEAHLRAPRVRSSNVCGQRQRVVARAAASAYAVRRLTPPVVDLGTYTPPEPGLVGNGETIVLEPASAAGSSFAREWVVVRISFHHRLVRGRYERDVTRLHVKEQSRWLLEKHLDSLL